MNCELRHRQEAKRLTVQRCFFSYYLYCYWVRNTQLFDCSYSLNITTHFRNIWRSWWRKKNGQCSKFGLTGCHCNVFPCRANDKSNDRNSYWSNFQKYKMYSVEYPTHIKGKLGSGWKISELLLFLKYLTVCTWVVCVETQCRTRTNFLDCVLILRGERAWSLENDGFSFECETPKNVWHMTHGRGSVGERYSRTLCSCWSARGVSRDQKPHWQVSGSDFSRLRSSAAASSGNFLRSQWKQVCFYLFIRENIMSPQHIFPFWNMIKSSVDVRVRESCGVV